MSDNDKVSIGFLVFNDIAFLPRAIESLLRQTHRDLEIIVSDDFSSDGSEEVCRHYAELDSRITYIRHPLNLGISRNMEFALSRATGDFFMWAADDDCWESTFVAALLSALKARPDCIVAFCPYQLIDEDDRPLAREPIRAVDYSGREPYARIRKLADVWDDGFGYGLFRRRLIEDVRFPVWWWVNAASPQNNIYPTLFLYLARADFILVDGPPLWFNRIKRNANYRLPFNGGILGEFAFALRRINMHIECALAVARGSRSVPLTVRTVPILLSNLTDDLGGQVVGMGKSAARKLLGLRRRT